MHFRLNRNQQRKQFEVFQDSFFWTIQWNLDLAKSLGTDQIRSLNRGFVVSRSFFIYFTIAGAKNTVRYIEVFVK